MTTQRSNTLASCREDPRVLRNESGGATADNSRLAKVQRISRARTKVLALIFVCVSPVNDSARAQCPGEKITPSGISAQDDFGRSVAISDNLLVVGNPFEDYRFGETTFEDVGAVYVFHRSEQGAPGPLDDTWDRIAELRQPFNVAEGARFGWSVAVSGDIVVVGAPFDDANGERSGSVFIYRWLGEGVFELRAEFNGPVSQLQAGWSVAADGMLVVAGAPNRAGEITPGRAYIYVQEGDLWTLEDVVNPPTGGQAGSFGWAVAVSASVLQNDVLLAVGSPFYDGVWLDSGAVYTFRRDDGCFPGPCWEEIDHHTPADLSLGDRFGTSLATDGDSFVAGAPYADAAGTDAGAVYAFDRTGLETFGQGAIIPFDDATGQDHFGASVSLDGDQVIVGAWGHDSSGAEAGAAFVYKRGGIPTWRQTAKLVAPDTSPGDWFGYSVAVGDAFAMSGAPKNDELGADAGAAYIFMVLDTDEDGVTDVCDNCVYEPNAAHTVATDCNDDGDTIDYGEAVGEQCDVDADGFGDACDNCAEHANAGQEDVDGDGVGVLCDNCTPTVPEHSCCPGAEDCHDCFNPDQADYDGDGLGDACDPAFGIGDELLPPHRCDGVGDPCTMDDDCPSGQLCQLDVAYSGVDIARTHAELALKECYGGSTHGGACESDGDCGPDGVCHRSIEPPTAAFYYPDVYDVSDPLGSGRLFINEPGTITVHWKDQWGETVGPPVVYVATKNPGTAPSGAPYKVAGVRYFLRYEHENTRVELGSLDYEVILNSTYRPGEDGDPDDVEVIEPGRIFTVHNRVAGHVVIRYTVGGGPLLGLEVVEITDELANPPEVSVEVGQMLEPPAGADCKGAFFRNEQDSNGFSAGWQREEDKTEVWPLRPITIPTDLTVVWYNRTPLGNCWHQSVRYYEATPPSAPQTHILDPDRVPETPLVDLAFDPSNPEQSLYCAVEVMYRQAFGSGPLPSEVDLANGRFGVRDPGYYVLRFDTKADRPDAGCDVEDRGHVDFLVVAVYDHDDLPSGNVFWDIGSQIHDPDHDPNTPDFPFGYLHAGQPYAPCIYGWDPPTCTTDDDCTPGVPCVSGVCGFTCDPDDRTAQIFPVNSADEHGRLEVWWFEESLGCESRVASAFSEAEDIYALNGTAVVVDGAARLTPAESGTLGSLIFTEETNAFAGVRASFDFQIGGGSGADGLSFAILGTDSFDTQDLFGEEGPPRGTSLAVSFDTYRNPEEPNDNHISVWVNHEPPNDLYAPYTPSFDLNDGRWHHVEINFVDDTLTVVVTPAGGIAEVAFAGSLGGVFGSDTATALIGFGARTGGLHDEHRLDNVRIHAARACGVYWPHKTKKYSPIWPVSGPEIVIASRQGTGTREYPTGAEVYGVGTLTAYQQDPRVATSLPGWNPNDEHGQVSPIAGSGRVFAVRDDNPWGVSSGHPYVLVRYPEMKCQDTEGEWTDVVCLNEGDCINGPCMATGPWRMGVHRVVGEHSPYFFDYSEFPSQTDPDVLFPVLAGKPIDPLFPVNFAVTCPQTSILGDALWVDRVGVAYGVEQESDEDGLTSIGEIHLWENWSENGEPGCQPWRDFDVGNGAPTPIIYRPQWPVRYQCETSRASCSPDSECPDNGPGDIGTCDPDTRLCEGGSNNGGVCNPDVECAAGERCLPCAGFAGCPTEDLRIGMRVDRTGLCGPVEILHDDVGIRIVDPTLWVTVAFGDSSIVDDLTKLPPHLVSGQISGGGGDWSDRIEYGSGELRFRGPMSPLDKQLLLDLRTGDTAYDQAIKAMYEASTQQVSDPAPPTPYVAPRDSAEMWVSVANGDAETGWVTLAFQNDADLCQNSTVQVETWYVDCPPAQGEVKVIEPQCPFNEKLVLQHSIDGGGQPESLIYQWQYSLDYDPINPDLSTWNDYPAPEGPDGCTQGTDCFVDGVGLREAVISGATPLLALGDSWWRARYRGYAICGCSDFESCNDPQSAWTGLDDHSVISDWTLPQLAEGWVKRVVRGVNPFDQRVEEFHTNAVATYVNMIQQAGMRFEDPVALNCTPANINNLGLIQVYEMVLRRAREISQTVSYDPANLAIQLVTSKIVDLYMLLGHEAFADASDPTIGLFAENPHDQSSYDPHVTFCFENQLPQDQNRLIHEELALLRGRDEIRPPDTDQDGRKVATVYNRLPWNFTSGNGQVAYANNYQVTELSDSDANCGTDGHTACNGARDLYPQGHGDAWGHYLTAVKKFYNLLKDPVFDWIVSTESVQVGGQPVRVGFQYERAFAKAAAAKARTGAEITSLTFRQRYTADPTEQDGYPDTDTDRAWGVSDWARRAGQAAYIDWAVANALLDDVDDDPDHEGIRKIDRTTVSEIAEIPAAFHEIQTALNNADRGLNPLGLATNIVPFGLDPDDILAGKTHFEQVFERAVSALANAVTVFDYANENTQRLRMLQDQQENFDDLVAERELDHKSRLIEIFGRPYPEDIEGNSCSGDCPTPTYRAGYNGADILHFGMVDVERWRGIDPGGTRIVEVELLSREVNEYTGEVEETVQPIQFNISLSGLGEVKPGSWTEREEPGRIQLAKGELMQAVGRFKQSLAQYESLIDEIDRQATDLLSLYALNDRVLQVRNSLLNTQTTLHEELRVFRYEEMRLRRSANIEIIKGNALAEALPGLAGLSTDFTSWARSAIRMEAAISAEWDNAEAEGYASQSLQKQYAYDQAATAQEIQITEWQGNFQVVQRISALLQAVRSVYPMQLELYSLEEAVRQANGAYLAAVGQGLRMLEQLEAFRQRTARDVSVYRYQDMAFRLFRNDALQKYRAQFDMAARYAFLAAKAYDYETGLLGTHTDSGREFLTNLVKERSLGVLSGGSPMPGNGLAGQLGSLSQNWTVYKPQLGFNTPDEFDRTFSLRWELLRIPNSSQYNAEWRTALEGYVVPDLNALPAYREFCQQLQPAQPNNPAIAIPFSTTVNSGLNIFGWESTGDETLPSDRFAIKTSTYGVRFSSYPGSPLNNQVNVYLVPVGSDIMRAPQCPDAPIRQWQLIDHTLPAPFPVGEQDFQIADWMPWDALTGGAAAMVQRRLIPTVAGCALNDASCTDMSVKLTGRSVWNTQWLLIIPESELAGSSEVDGIDVFIHGTTGSGVRDIKILLRSYGYSGCVTGSLANSESEVMPLVITAK